jgi:hypothetical protein
MLQVSHANVSKLDIIFSMLQTLTFDVADVESRCCRHVLLVVANINFADVEFQCCRHVVLGVVLRRGQGKMLDVARNTGRNMAAI